MSKKSVSGFIAIVSFLFTQVIAQVNYQWTTQKSSDGKYTYKTVSGDPLGVRIYTLENGLTVMLSVNKNEPSIQTLIATKAGSKNDPADNTGLAHYLEHMLFKGTDKYGTKNWQKEKEQLDKIDALYEKYNKSKDEKERKAIYKQIDSVSLIASGFAIANEYDKMLSAIGATGTNAFTSVEQTVYVNSVPSNQLENWLTIEAERFRNPVLRLFHTELEAVYEEKNISLDNDSRKVYEALLGGMFQKHAYGTQTTIGTVEHLKNPSLNKIRNYYNQYYVPNNMAIILAGDLDPDKAVRMIDEKFKYMKSKSVPAYTFEPEVARQEPIVKNIVGPDAESVMLGFRMPGATKKEARILSLFDYILSNSKAGLIDLNLVQKQKVVSAYSSTWMNKDYSIHMLGGKPREGQTLEDVKDLLLQQIEEVRNGRFDDALLPAIISNFKVEQIKGNESNAGRAYNMLGAFCVDQDWLEEVKSIDELSKITKTDITNFVKKFYGNDYVLIYKRTGEDNNIVKIEKPEITAVEVNREDESPFVKQLINSKPEPVKPVFIDFDKDIQKSTLNKNIPLFYIQNKENKLFSLYYVLDMGRFHQIKLPLAIDLLKYLGTDKYTPEQISMEFYKLACQFGVSSGDEQTYVYLSGLEENFEAAVKLFEHLLLNAKADQTALNQMVDRILKQRTDAKLNKSSIFWGALRSYMIYGENSPQKYMLKEQELKSLKADELISMIKEITSYNHKVYYYGPRELNGLNKYLSNAHITPTSLKPYPTPVKFERRNTNDKKVFFVDYKMVQAEVVWMNKQPQAYDPKLTPTISLFNEYFGGGMSSVVFQTIRESKALAYSTFSRYTPPSKTTDPYYITAYVGTQADKLNEAIPAMNELLNELPVSANSFANVKEALKNQIETERITKEDIFFTYMSAQKLGLKEDPRKQTYEQLNQLTMSDLKVFFDKQYKSNTYHYGIMGSKDRINLGDLKKYGELVELNLTDIFGY